MIILLISVFLTGLATGFAVAATLAMRDFKKLRDSIANAESETLT